MKLFHRRWRTIPILGIQRPKVNIDDLGVIIKAQSYSLILLCSLTSSLALAADLSFDCEDKLKKKRARTKVTRNTDGTIKSIEYFFKAKPKVLSRYISCENNMMVATGGFNINSGPVFKESYSHNSDGTFTYKAFDVYLDQQPVKEQSIELLNITGKRQLVKKWKYEKTPHDTYALKRIDHYGPLGEKVLQRELYSYRKLTQTFLFEYEDGSDFVANLIVEFPSGDYSLPHNFFHDSNIEKILTDHQEEQKLAQHLDQTRRKAVIIDSGFDLGHPDLNYHFSVNPKDPIDGIDNDGNGWIDDTYGGFFNKDGSFSGNVNERLKVTDKDKKHLPFSHGTHVASIAFKDIEKFGLYGFGGNIETATQIPLMAKFINDQKVEFVNMSLAFEQQEDPRKPEYKHIKEYKKLFKANPETLFVVAAGNAGVELIGKQNVFPASVRDKNVLTVGALSVSTLEELGEEMGAKADFSNYSSISVDIFAPGELVLGANFAQMHVPMSGTSMASPWVMNMAMKIASINQSLTPLEVKKIILLTAKFTDFKNMLPCTSGGRVHPKTAEILAKLMTDSSQKDIYQLAIEAREHTNNFPNVANWRELMLDYWKRKRL